MLLFFFTPGSFGEAWLHFEAGCIKPVQITGDPVKHGDQLITKTYNFCQVDQVPRQPASKGVDGQPADFYDTGRTAQGDAVAIVAIVKG